MVLCDLPGIAGKEVKTSPALRQSQAAASNRCSHWRALTSAPKILLIGEPSVGLAPVLVQRTIEKIQELKERHQLTVLTAEQNFSQAVRIADRGYAIVHGKIALEGGSAEELNNNELEHKFYLRL